MTLLESENYLKENKNIKLKQGERMSIEIIEFMFTCLCIFDYYTNYFELKVHIQYKTKET